MNIWKQYVNRWHQISWRLFFKMLPISTLAALPFFYLTQLVEQADISEGVRNAVALASLVLDCFVLLLAIKYPLRALAADYNRPDKRRLMFAAQYMFMFHGFAVTLAIHNWF